MKVLAVVEDDPDMTELIRFTLRSDHRFELDGTAATAAEAIMRARMGQPDLIILDHFILGDVNGLEAAPRLKEVAPGAKVLLFSSHDLTAEASMEPAIDAFLPKSRLPDLLPTARALLGLASDLSP
ncbi:MAG TPA: response regulator transcription factor [Actinomycetota bacterium]